jgi:hypothetical protein
MPSDQTPRQPQAHSSGGQVQAGQDAEDLAVRCEFGFAEALAGESGDPIWEPALPAQGEAGRAERARRAVREPEGKLPAGRIIDLEQIQLQRAARPR